jgi:hypothetical protein
MYYADSVTVIAKNDLPNTAGLWTNNPGRLVVITCLQNPAGTPSVANFVITAHLADLPVGQFKGVLRQG